MALPTLGQTEIIRTFIALALLLASAFLFGTLIEKIKGPRVVGEILGGMIIGGSGLFLRVGYLCLLCDQAPPGRSG
jgi:Kef-type K+ transport system membrane component KefB